MTTINDPLFGTLEVREEKGWSGKAHVPFLDQEFELQITNTGSPTPNEAQREAWQQFMALQSQLKTSVEQALYQHYNKNLEQFRIPFEKAEAQEFAPDLENPSDIWALLEAKQWLWLDTTESGTPTIMIEFATRWDEEHGIMLEFFQGQIGLSEGGVPWEQQNRYDLQGVEVT